MINEESNIALNVQAKILPQIEGAAEFEQRLQSLPNSIQQRMSEVSHDPQFTQQLSQKEIEKVQRLSTTEDMLQLQKFQELQKDILEDMDIDISAGRLTLSQERKYIKKLGRQKQEIDNLAETYIDELESDYFKELGPDRKTILKEAILTGAEEAKEYLDQLIEKFKVLRENVNSTNKEAESFFNQLQKAGIFAIGGMVLNEGMKWIGTEAQIEAKNLTSFDLTSPIGMYQERRMFDVFQETRERERLFGSVGMGIGGIAGALIGGVPGAMAGAYFGGQMGNQIAGLFNIDTEAAAQEELKILNQSYGTLSGYVGSSQGYDISRARARAAYGNGIFGSLGLGYTPDQEVQMRMQLGKSLGRFDEGLFSEQTTFARALGLDPGELYQLNLSGRVTGADYGINGLSQARQLTNRIFGDDASPQRIIDILSELKTINEQQLRLNIDADSKSSLSFAQIPELIFGTSNPYGRLGDLGGTTLKLLEGMMNPRGAAHEAFLFQAMGGNNILEFSESMKGGIYSGNNLNNIMDMVRKYSGGSDQMAYFMLNEMMPGAPEGFIPELAKLINDPERLKEFKERNSEGVSEAEVMKQLGIEAKKAVSETEKTNEEITKLRYAAADQWRETINEASKKMAEFWDMMGSNTKLHAELLRSQEEGFKYFDDWRNRKGFWTPDEEIEGERRANKILGKSHGGMYSPHREDRTNELSEEARIFQESVQSFKSSVDSLRSINITVNGVPVNPGNSNYGL